MGFITSFFSPGGNPLPPSVNATFVIILIFGLLFLFFEFILRFWKYYWAEMRPMMQKEKEEQIKKINQEKTDNFNYGNINIQEKMISTIDDIYKNLLKMSEKYSGKYLSKIDFNQNFDKLEKRVEKNSEDLAKIKGQLDIE